MSTGKAMVNLLLTHNYAQSLHVMHNLHIIQNIHNFCKLHTNICTICTLQSTHYCCSLLKVQQPNSSCTEYGGIYQEMYNIMSVTQGSGGQRSGAQECISHRPVYIVQPKNYPQIQNPPTTPPRNYFPSQP